LFKPVLVVAANKLTRPLGVQNVEIGRTEGTAAPVLGKGLLDDGAYLDDRSSDVVVVHVVHLGEESLNYVGAAAASPEVEVEPDLAPEGNTSFHQGLHSVKLTTLQSACCQQCKQNSM